MDNKDPRTYIRLHDGMPDHPKIDNLSDAAFRLLITLWCWSSRHLTDGVIPVMTWTKRGSGKAREELLRAGLASISQPTGETVVMHDYLVHQRSADEVAQMRDKRRAAGAMGSKAKARNVAKRVAPATRPVANGVANGVAPALASAKQTPSKLLSKNVAETETYTETEKEQEQLRAPAPPAQDEHKIIWDALVAACNINAGEITKSQRGSLNAAVADLREIDAKPSEIPTRARRYREAFPNAACTPPALVKHWATLGQRGRPQAQPATGGGW